MEKGQFFSMKKLFLLVIFFILLPSLASAIDYPEISNFVTDQAGVIDDVIENELILLARGIEQGTTVEVAIVTVNSLEDLDIETYAVELFEEAGIGKKDVDNGLLILIAPNERMYRIEVGFGLEGVIPDIEARQIGVRVLEPAFRQGAYGEGLVVALKIINGFVSEDEEVISAYRSTYARNSSGSNKFMLYLFLFLMISSAIGGKYGRRGGMGFFPIMVGGYGGGLGSGSSGSSSGLGGFGGFGGGLSGGGGFSGSF